MFEVLAQNSELGELRNTVKLQEQMLETWRNKANSLSKQSRDLEIVKSRLITDIKNREKDTGKSYDVMPVKITRSVGLQVCLQQQTPRPRVPVNTPPVPPPVATPMIPQRKARVSLPPRLPNNPIPSIGPLNRLNVPQMNASLLGKNSPVKTVKTILPAKEPSLLSKVLQKQPSVTPISLQQKKSNEASKAVIDLTDEDENTKTTTTAPVSGSSTTIGPGSVRLVPQQQMGSVSMASNVTTPVMATSMPGPRLTYLVTSGQQPQQVMLHTLATSTAQMRPGMRNIMLKPITPTGRFK